MTDEVVIICPELRAGAGGLADYTLRVVEQWGNRWPVRFLVPQTNERRRALRDQLPSGGGRVLLQYSGYGFDHFGYPRGLLRELADWKQKSDGLFVIMLHEIWTFWPRLNKNFLVQQLHRRDLACLVRRADAVFTSTASQAEHLHGLAPEREVTVLPVGSNIRVQPATGTAREPGLAVLFGLQASRVRALQKMQVDLKSLGVGQRLEKLVTAGGGNTCGQDEHRLLSDLALARGFEERGALTEEAISSLLSRASFGISAQDELSVTKSGTFMAYAAHGVNILSPFSGAARPQPLCWATHPEELRQGLSEGELKSRAENLRTWQERTCAWPRIAEQFARALALPAPASHS